MNARGEEADTGHALYPQPLVGVGGRGARRRARLPGAADPVHPAVGVLQVGPQLSRRETDIRALLGLEIAACESSKE